MNVRKLEDLLRKVKSGRTTIDEAVAALKSLPFEDLGFTRIDHHRSLRRGFPEVIWGQGKTPGQILSIMKQLKRKGQNILITRLEERKVKTIQKIFPKSHYYPRSQVLTYLTHPVESEGKGTILVVTAGTTDIPVAEEAAVGVSVAEGTSVSGVQLKFRRKTGTRAFCGSSVAACFNKLQPLCGSCCIVSWTAMRTSVSASSTG